MEDCHRAKMESDRIFQLRRETMMRKALDRFLEGYVRLQVSLRGLVEDARGLQTLEWVGLAIVILALLGAIALYLNNSGEGTVGKAVANAIRHFFDQLTKTQGQ